jgi:hypothetical protein
MRKFKTNLRNVVAIAICLVGFTVFSGCDKENPNNDNETNNNKDKIDKGFGWIKYDGETYYLQSKEQFMVNPRMCWGSDCGGKNWWYCSYGVDSWAKNANEKYALLYLDVINSEFLPLIGTFTRIQYGEYCSYALEKGIVCSGTSIVTDCDFGAPGVLIYDNGTENSEDLTSGNFTVNQTNDGYEVIGTFATQSGKIVEFEYEGKFYLQPF